ncbi:putative tRNA-splicing endonuclease subunit tsp-5 [Podospora fimiseda]|uniref:tRNA-splicing endonuclease subunit tsp-5 n=1 Tax=Podospora fimiseda TaxID=252190 RepID=A0AAN7GZ53_9PEZI|nr:putative tRNA-splicing endonuclease subunit tsp-5 [Podospora fimiseda]
MPFDDDNDNPTLTPSFPSSSTSSPSADPLLQPDEDEDEDEDDDAPSHNFLLFKKQPNISAQTIRKGEKDFESHGTLLQSSALEASRNAMQEVLSYSRVHASSGATVKGWYFPDRWKDYVESKDPEGKSWGHFRDRVVILDGSNTSTQNLGRAVVGQKKGTPGRGKDWLLPEDALYLVERGSMELWWPRGGLETVFPGGEEPKEGEEDEYAKGVPVSLQGAYALLIGGEGERGKISLRRFQVYSNLKRCGYLVVRAPPRTIEEKMLEEGRRGLWEWLSSTVAGWTERKPAAFGPLVKPGLYRSYAQIYRQMALIPRHKPLSVEKREEMKDPFGIHYIVWKSAHKWSKLRQPPPDFYLSVVDAQETMVPQLGEISGLIAATPPAGPKPEWTGPGRIYARLKHGHRNALIAVVDHGVINYMRFAEAAFGEENVTARFDYRKRVGGPKHGGWRGGKEVMAICQLEQIYNYVI